MLCLLLLFCLLVEFQAPTSGKVKRKDRDSKKSPSKARSQLDKKRKSSSRSKKERQQEPPPKKICTSLRVLDWLWRDLTKQFSNTEEHTETAAAYHARKSIALHPQFVKAGIVHRLPRMHAFARQHEHPDDIPGRVYDPPRRRHSDKQYAELCSRLMNCLQGQARLFVTCEFFYSDLDREW